MQNVIQPIAQRHLPDKAGTVARLHYFDEVKSPSLRGNDIFLPRQGNFYPLQSGKQFLLRMRHPGYKRHAYFFGGTDESSAFLAQILSYEIWEAFKNRGERAFYLALKPAIVKHYERRFKERARRQGDVYAVRIPQWELFRSAWLTIFSDSLELKPKKFGSVFGSHRLKGECADKFPALLGQAIGGRPGHDDFQEFMFARGVISAPDHAPLVLDDVHLVAPSTLVD